MSDENLPPDVAEPQMTDMELAEEIERGHVLVIASAPFQSVPIGAKDQIIAALRRGPEPVPDGFVHTVPDPSGRTMCTAETMGQLAERSPSGEMVMEIVKAVMAIEYDHWVRNGSAIKIEDAPMVALDVQRALSAAEAEGRKPCPLCGRTEPHSHTSGPLGIS